MTREELNVARNLREELRSKENRLAVVRKATTNLLARYDGLPPTKSNSSPVEKIIIVISDLEEQIKELESRLDAARMSLLEKICAEELSARETEILIRRYVNCQRFRDIGFEMNLSDATTFRLHDAALEKLTVL